jgi:hypothetical protein
MKHRIAISVLFFVSLTGLCLCQTTNPPLNHAEILGRLASNSSPSYIAHLVKTSGINFNPDAHFLSLISLAGGNGILYERISGSRAADFASLSPDSDPPFEHLAKCAELVHSVAQEKI